MYRLPVVQQRDLTSSRFPIDLEQKQRRFRLLEGFTVRAPTLVRDYDVHSVPHRNWWAPLSVRYPAIDRLVSWVLTFERATT